MCQFPKRHHSTQVTMNVQQSHAAQQKLFKSNSTPVAQVSSPKSLTLTRNLWTFLPRELKDRVLDFSDPLTQYLHNHNIYKPCLVKHNPVLANQVWKSVFDLDWADGDLAILPLQQIPTLTSGLMLVQSRRMFQNLTKLVIPPSQSLSNTTTTNNSTAPGTFIKYTQPSQTNLTSEDLIHIPLRQFWLDLIQSEPKHLINHAIIGGHLKYIQLLESLKLLDTADYIRLITQTCPQHGYLDVLKYLHATQSDLPDGAWSTVVMDTAAAYGHVAMVRFLHENRKEGCTTEALDRAAAKNHIDMVQYLHEIRSNFVHCFRGSRAMDLAAQAGNLDIVIYLHEKGYSCTTAAIDSAASNGFIEVVKFLNENRSEGCTTNAMDTASAHGHFDVVKYLHEQSCQSGKDVRCTTNAMDLAAQGGHMGIVRFLHENRNEGCSVSPLVVEAAQGPGGKREVLEFYMERRPKEFKEAAVLVLGWGIRNRDGWLVAKLAGKDWIDESKLEIWGLDLERMAKRVEESNVWEELDCIWQSKVGVNLEEETFLCLMRLTYATKEQ
jgi:ArsR family metal-binding transcriptional regulator